jgi:hypothetical protein
MPDHVWILLWAVCLVLLAGVFGGIAGGVTWWLGRGSGTAVGHRAVRALAELTGTRFSRTVTGSLVGAADGLLLATVGIVVVLLLEPGRALLASAEFRLASLLLAVVLGGAAILLGSLAHLLVWAGGSGRNAIGGFAFAFFVVALLTGRARVGNPMLLGLLAGAVAGSLALVLSRPAGQDKGQDDTSFVASPPDPPSWRRD